MPVANVNGTTLHYREAGAAHRDVLVLLHAFPLHSGMWTRQLESLGARHRVIAPDWRGLGRSGPAPEASTMDLLAEDVRALLDHLRVARATIAGLSMGGYVAFELFRRAPDRFRGLVLCDTRANADDEQGRATRETFARTALEKGLPWVADEMTPKLLRKDPDPAIVREVRALVAEGTPAGVAAGQRGMARRPDSTGTLARAGVPVLVVVGEEDGITPPEVAEAMAKAARSGRLVRIPRAGHLSNVENPEAFDAALADFLATVPA